MLTFSCKQIVKHQTMKGHTMKKEHSDDPLEQMFIGLFGPTDFDDPDQTGISALLEDEDVLHWSPAEEIC